MLIISGGSSFNLLWFKSRAIKRTKYPRPAGKLVSSLDDKFCKKKKKILKLVRGGLIITRLQLWHRHAPNIRASPSLQSPDSVLSSNCILNPTLSARWDWKIYSANFATCSMPNLAFSISLNSQFLRGAIPINYRVTIYKQSISWSHVFSKTSPSLGSIIRTSKLTRSAKPFTFSLSLVKLFELKSRDFSGSYSHHLFWLSEWRRSTCKSLSSSSVKSFIVHILSGTVKKVDQ